MREFSNKVKFKRCVKYCYLQRVRVSKSSYVTPIYHNKSNDKNNNTNLNSYKNV